jgi:hypothetical protein
MFTQFQNFVQRNIGTTPVTIVTCPAANQLVINQLSCANTTRLPVTCTVTIIRASVTVFVVNEAVVPGGGALACAGFDQKLVIMAGDVIQVRSNTANSIDCVISGVLNDFNRTATVPAPPTSPAATFNITPSSLVIGDSQTVTFNVTTTNVPNGTVLYWENFGTVSREDFTDGLNQGEFVINSNVGTFSRTLKATGQLGDPFGEGQELIQMAVQFRPGFIGGNPVTATTVTVVPDTIVTLGLVLNLDVNNPSSYPGSGTTWFDLSSFNHNFTLHNGAFYQSNPARITFDGDDDNVGASTPTALQIKNDKTLFFWWKHNSSGGDDWGTLIRTGLGADLLYCLASIRSARHLAFHWYDGSFRTIYSTNNGFNLDAFNFGAVVISGLTASFYINGQLSGTGAVTVPSPASATQIGIGATRSGSSVGTTGQDLAGDISLVQIYNRALSAAEVVQNYTATRSRFLGTIVTSGLVLNLDAGNTSSYQSGGTTWSDLSGNGNNATMFGSVPYEIDVAPCFNFATITGTTSANASLGFTFTTAMIPTTGNFTLSFWVKNMPASVGQQGLFSNTGGANGYRFGIGRNGIYYLIGPDYTENSVGFSATLSADAWHNVVAVFSRTTAQILLYRNGVFQGTGSMPASQTAFSNNPPGIVRSACCGIYTGKLGAVSAYNRTLSATEILQNFKATRTRYGE